MLWGHQGHVLYDHYNTILPCLDGTYTCMIVWFLIIMGYCRDCAGLECLLVLHALFFSFILNKVKACIIVAEGFRLMLHIQHTYSIEL